MKNPQSSQAFPSSLTTLARCCGVPLMRRDKSMMGIESSAPCREASAATSSKLSSVAKIKEEGIEVKLGESAMDLTLAIANIGVHTRFLLNIYIYIYLC